MNRHHSIYNVFAQLRQKKSLISRFTRRGLLPVHVSIFLFVVLVLTVNFLTEPSAVNAQSASSFQPTRASIYGTFYYPWYKNQSTDGTWSYWQDSNYSPPNSWFSNYLPLRPGTLNTTTGAINSVAGLYSSRDKDTFYWQLNGMAQAKLEIAISSWWGRSTSTTSDNAGPNAVEGKSDFTFRKIVTNWMNLSDNPYPNLRWTLYYEKEGAANPSVAEIAADLTYLNSNYASQPSFFKINGRPVIFAYGDPSDACAMVDRWLQARAQSGTNFYIVLKLFSGYTSCASQPDSWHEYAPAARSGNYSTYASFISPGFWKVGDPTARLARNLTEFDTAATAMVAANTKWKLVQTWNEWGEGTSVEPGIQVQQTKAGTASVASNATPFEDKYIQVLAQRFPALQAGTGAGVVGAGIPTPVPTQAQAATPTPVPTQAQGATPTPSATTIFLVLMENHNWSQIKNSTSAPYINSLLTKGAHAEAYFNPPKLHPSEPNYIWLEAGTNFGVKNDSDPASNHQASKAHLTTLLDGAGISWKAYQENITGTTCPLSSSGLYAAKHNPMIFFDDVTGVNNPKSAYCIEHERPYTELAPDMASGKVARYNFITPNLCNDMHNSSGCTTTNSILNGDNWLKQEIPKILASDAYKKGGIIFITWDEGEGGDGPIGMIVLSSGAKVGYSNTIRYTHSSTLRTVQEIFGVQPLLGDAANATSMSDLFSVFPGPGTSLPTNTPVSPTKTPVLTNTQAPPTATVTPAKTATPVNTATVAPPSSTPIASGGGGSITVDVAADAYISDAGPTTNFGSSPTLRTDASPVIQSYLRFIVPPLSANVVSAQLRVYANTGVSTGYSVSGTTGSWTETGLTFSNAPIFGSSVGNSGPITAFTWTTIDVTSLVKGSGQYNFVMTTTSNTATSLVSKEGAAGQRPQLIVNMGTNTGNQTPQPTTTPIATLAPINTATAVPTMTLPAPTNTAIATVAAASPTAVLPTATVTSVLPSNTAIPAPSSPTPSGPTFTVEVNPSSGTVGSTVSAVLKMSNMVNLYGLQAECKVDPNILGGTGHIEGDIFTSANSFIVDSGFQADGTWSVASSLLNPAPAFTGSGTAFSLNFTVKNVGQTPVECTVLAVDLNGNLLPISVVNSTFDSTQPAAPTPVPTIIPPTFTPAPPTAEPLPTQTPTFEPTLPPQPGAISGVVKYEKHPDQSGIAITISQNGTPVAQGQSGADGSFQFSNVPVGQYLVQFSAQGYLSASTTVDVQAGEGATTQVTLLAGDIDNNGVIDLADASLIGANYRIQAPPAPVQADLNGDGFINLVDLVLVGKNLGETAQ